MREGDRAKNGRDADALIRELADAVRSPLVLGSFVDKQ